MSSIVILLLIIGAIALSKSSSKKNTADTAQKREVPVEVPHPVWPVAPAQPTVAPTVAPAAEEPHVHTRHVVAPSYYTGHAHEESSLSGEGPSCVPVEVRKAPVVKETTQASGLPKLEFDSDSVLKGILYGEILGKPKALR